MDLNRIPSWLLAFAQVIGLEVGQLKTVVFLAILIVTKLIHTDPAKTYGNVTIPDVVAEGRFLLEFRWQLRSLFRIKATYAPAASLAELSERALCES